MPWADVPAFEMSPCVARAAAPASVERMGEHPSTLGSLAGLEAVATGSCRSACGEMDVFDASGTMTLNRPKSPDPRSQCGRGYGLVWTSISMNMFDSDPRLAPSPSSPRFQAALSGWRGFSRFAEIVPRIFVGLSGEQCFGSFESLRLTLVYAGARDVAGRRLRRRRSCLTVVSGSCRRRP